MITPSIVVTALRDLGISELRNAIKRMDDGGAGMLGPVGMAGCGVEVDVTIPSGGGEIAQIEARHRQARRKPQPPPARAARHHPRSRPAPSACGSPTPAHWTSRIGPSPLVTDPDMTADLYSGRAPWGENLRGDRIALSLLQRHLLITPACPTRAKPPPSARWCCGWSLQPAVELRIADLKGIGDWRMFAPIASKFIQGPRDRTRHRRHRNARGWGAGDEPPNGDGRSVRRQRQTL